MLKRLLEHPLTRGRDLDSPETTELRKAIIRSKPFLRSIYEEWYSSLLKETDVEKPSAHILELGSGAGFLKDHAPRVIASDLIYVDGLDLVMDGQRIPFKVSSLDAIVMVNVLHHIPDPKAFFTEAANCIRSGGKIAMIEPWITPWSKFVYRYFHHEPVVLDSSSWTIQGHGPLSGANTALPWIIFSRDKDVFVNEMKQWRVETIQPFMPFRYPLSGGISLRNLMFSSSFTFWRGIERLLSPWMEKLAMFAKIVLVRQ